MIDYALPLPELPDPLPIARIERPFDVVITVPGSKSETNRVYVLAALAHGTSRIGRPLRSDDCDRLAAALETLGAGVRWDGEDAEITGVGGRFQRGGRVDLGDGGTPTRFMIAAACLASEPVIVDGSPRMRERPVAEGVDMLRRLGAEIEYLEAPERLPVRVLPSEAFGGGRLAVGATLSSQFISAVMLVAPFLERGVELGFEQTPTSASYVHMTVDVLQRWGAFLDGATGLTSLRVPPCRIEARSMSVAPDASSAAYWLTAAALVPGARTVVPGLGDGGQQPDLGIPWALEHMGATRDAADRHARGLRGPRQLEPMHFDARDCPDGALALAVACACARGRSLIEGLHTLRVKETDRIAALANELRRVGCSVETTDDSIAIDPATMHDEPVVIETYDDHRMAMAFSVLGLARGGISIADPGCVAKSYPGFFGDLAKLYASG